MRGMPRELARAWIQAWPPEISSTGSMGGRHGGVGGADRAHRPHVARVAVVEEGDEPGEATFHDDLDDGVGFLQARLGPGVGVVVHLDRDDPAVEQGLVLHRQAVQRRGGAGGQGRRRGRGGRGGGGAGGRGGGAVVVAVVVGAVVVVVVVAACPEPPQAGRRRAAAASRASRARLIAGGAAVRLRCSRRCAGDLRLAAAAWAGRSRPRGGEARGRDAGACASALRAPLPRRERAGVRAPLASPRAAGLPRPSGEGRAVTHRHQGSLWRVARATASGDQAMGRASPLRHRAIWSA